MRAEATETLQYIREVFCQEDICFQQVRESVSGYERHIQIAPDEGKILQILTALIMPKKIVEVGVLAGYSTSHFARIIPEDAIIYAIEKDAVAANRSITNFKLCNIDHKIKLLQGDATEVLLKISKDGPFDMIFIDANKAGYCDYLDWAEENIRKGGVIIADNTLLFGTVIKNNSVDLPKNVPLKSYEVMREFNLRLADQSKYLSILLPTSSGMTVAIKKF